MTHHERLIQARADLGRLNADELEAVAYLVAKLAAASVPIAPPVASPIIHAAAEDDTPISLTEIQSIVPSWPWTTPRTYQLARASNDGRPVLATIRIGKRRFTTRRAISAYLAARMDATPMAVKPRTPEQLERRRATRAANKAKAVQP